MWRAEYKQSFRNNERMNGGVHPPTNYQGIFSSWVWESLLPVKRSLHSMEFQDKSLACMDCGADFIFTAGEQLFFQDKQFKNEPKRCKFCKAKRTATFGPAGPGAVPVYNKVETRTICSQCNKETTVPFRPSQGRPVLCRECFQQTRAIAVAV